MMVHFNDYILPDNYDKLIERNYSEADLRDHEIETKLGEGAFGTVYLSRLRKDNELVAIKKISKQKGRPDVVSPFFELWLRQNLKNSSTVSSGVCKLQGFASSILDSVLWLL